MGARVRSSQRKTKMIALPKTQLIQALTKTVPRGNAASVPAVAACASSKVSDVVVQPPPQKYTNYSLSKDVTLGALRVSNSLAGTSQVRFAHTDLKVPDFTEYRKENVKSANASHKGTDSERKMTSYLIVGAGSVATVYGAKALVHTAIGNLSPAADVVALSKIEIKLSDIPEGRSMTFKWRGKPLFLRHRTDEEIATEQAVDIASLRDGQSDEERVKNQNFLLSLESVLIWAVSPLLMLEISEATTAPATALTTTDLEEFAKAPPLSTWRCPSTSSWMITPLL